MSVGCNNKEKLMIYQTEKGSKKKKNFYSNVKENIKKDNGQ
jgi:hypothetical protein